MNRTRAFISLIEEINEPKTVRKGFIKKRKHPFSISDVRINELYDTYFPGLSLNHKTFSFEVNPNDFEEIIYLLRVHFQLWVEIEGNTITIYQEFPVRFRIGKAVHKENHPHTPISIPAGTVMELSANSYGVVNYSNGIPLTGKILTESDNPNSTLNSSLQINYPFIEALH
jgi:hypothetical protein